MGGYGSTRWRGHNKKWCVEDCLHLSTDQMASAGAFGHKRGRIKWWKGQKAAETAHHVEHHGQDSQGNDELIHWLCPPFGRGWQSQRALGSRTVSKTSLFLRHLRVAEWEPQLREQGTWGGGHA